MNISELNLEQLLELQANIANEIDTRRVQEEQNILNDIRGKAAKLGLSVEDIVAKLHGKTKRTVAAQFRDPATGTEWSGRGRKPLWVQAWIDAGRSIDDLRI